MKYFISAVLVLVSLTVSARTHEITSMKEIIPFVRPRTLVVFDIDNTIAESPETIGSVQWQEYEVEKAKREGLNSQQALERSIRKFIAVNFALPLKPVEAESPSIIRSFQQSGIRVMALTARPVELLKRTDYLLNEIGVDLKIAAPIRGILSTFFKEQAVYQNGIFAVGPINDKGELLKWLMVQPGFPKFNHVVFVDDKEKYVLSLEKTLENLNIPNDLFRYSAADHRVQSFDTREANAQTNYFETTGKIIRTSWRQ